MLSYQQGKLNIAVLGQKIKGWIEYAKEANSYKLRGVSYPKTC